MPDAISIIAAVTALVAVVVGPIVSVWIARRQIRASVVSTNRQDWINTLRDSISDCLAKQTMIRKFNALEYADNSSLPRIEEVIMLCTRIELLINPNEPDHAELAEQICKITNTLNQQNSANSEFDVDAAHERVIRLSQSILKREWERVKSGD